MPRIAIPDRDDAPAESRSILDNVNRMLGFVPNLQRLMSISPNALAGWAGLMGALSKTLDVKTRDGIALAVSERSRRRRSLSIAKGDQASPSARRQSRLRRP